ncbi:MAG: hypothetical protein LC659_08305 [Myxococcales bacterium]|nr:hypothetical protein [Myxococcales bacterium]
MAEELKVGGELDAWCTSCRLMKWHTIVALVGGKPAKVECQGCHKQHQFRAQPPGAGEKPEKAPRAKRATRTATPALPAVDFETLLAGREGEAKAYSPNDSYALNDAVRHPTFGVGVITGTPAPQKIEISFRDGSKKILLHDRGGAQASKLAPPPRREEGAPRTGTSDSPRGQK